MPIDIRKMKIGKYNKLKQNHEVTNELLDAVRKYIQFKRVQCSTCCSTTMACCGCCSLVGVTVVNAPLSGKVVWQRTVSPAVV